MSLMNWIVVMLLFLFLLWYGADSMGAMGAKKLWGDAPKSPPQEFCYVNFRQTVK